MSRFHKRKTNAMWICLSTLIQKLTLQSTSAFNFIQKYECLSKILAKKVRKNAVNTLIITLCTSGVWSNLQVGAQYRRAGQFFFDVPHFSLVPPPHMTGQRLFVTDWETIEVSPSASSAVCTSTGEVGRGAIKVMGPSAVPCRLLGY